MNVGARYYMETGETVSEAVRRMYPHYGVDNAAIYIGFSSATMLRVYLARHGIPDPWPIAGKRGGWKNIIPDDVLEEFARRWRETGSQKKAAAGLGYRSDSLYDKMKRKEKEQCAKT